MFFSLRIEKGSFFKSGNADMSSLSEASAGTGPTCHSMIDKEMRGGCGTGIALESFQCFTSDYFSYIADMLTGITDNSGVPQPQGKGQFRHLFLNNPFC